MTRAVLAAALLAAASGCGDSMGGTDPSGAPLAVAVRASAQAAEAFAGVDGMFVEVTRNDRVMVADSFAISPSGGEVRRTYVVMLDEEQEDVGVYVELRSQGVPRYAGAADVRLVRGRRTVAEIVVDSLGLPPDPAKL